MQNKPKKDVNNSAPIKIKKIQNKIIIVENKIDVLKHTHDKILKSINKIKLPPTSKWIVSSGFLEDTITGKIDFSKVHFMTLTSSKSIYDEK